MFYLALRQAEVLTRSVLKLLGQGEWNATKHGRARRRWTKLHVAVDADTGEIPAHMLTEGHADDAAQVERPTATELQVGETVVNRCRWTKVSAWLCRLAVRLISQPLMLDFNTAREKVVPVQ